jgi:hypothetical protein
MYIYTTPVFEIVNTFLRSKRLIGLGKTSLSRKSLASLARDVFNGLSVDQVSKMYIVGDVAKRIVVEARAMQKKISTEADSIAVDDMYSSVERYLTPRYYSDAKRYALNQHSGIAFYRQILDELPETRHMTLEKVCETMHTFSVSTWKSIVRRFIDDLNAIFEKMPVVPKAVGLVVYRGENQKPKAKAADPAYRSTSLSRKVAQSFSPSGSVSTIEVPGASKVLPLFTVTRYWTELEILLPRT